MPHDRATSLVVLGTDVLVAARPATPVQLAHACHALGYHGVVPASWGDELVAGACLDALATRGDRRAILCSCPRVAHRLLATGADLAPALISLVAPPIAVARYLRAIYAPARIRVTYVGLCPAGADPSIDARLAPQELFDTMLDREVVLLDQPATFDDVIPPDRRRFMSLPGGAPAPEILAERLGMQLREARADDLALELTQWLLADEHLLVDPAPHLACSCSGVVPGLTNGDARAQVVSIEPPRARAPVVNAQLVASLDMQLPLAARTPIDVASMHAGDDSRELLIDAGSPALLLEAGSKSSRQSPMRGIAMVPALPAEEPRDLAPIPRRRSPAQGVLRPPADSMPNARSADGRVLPRAYVARRKAGPWKQSPARPDRAEDPPT